MEITRAQIGDIKAIDNLLRQVLTVHHNARPDLFKSGVKKYTDEQLAGIITDDSKPIFVAKENDKVLGYAFCMFVCHRDDNILTDIKTLYIDDLCVDENARGKHIGRQLYEYVLEFAKNHGCYNVTLNVWADNTNAVECYKKCGLKPQKIGMEKIL